jgi:hypothetical protein
MDSNTLKGLQTFCRNNQIKGFSKYKKKQELLTFINNEISLRDAQLAKQLFDSEDEFMKKKQEEIMMKQKKEIEEKKQKAKAMKDQQLAKEHMMKMKQDDEYQQALQEDLRQMEEEKKLQAEQEMVKYKEEKDKKYAAKISNDDLQLMRMARLARFN